MIEMKKLWNVSNFVLELGSNIKETNGFLLELGLIGFGSSEFSLCFVAKTNHLGFNNIFVYLYDHFPILSSYFPLFTLFLLSESLCMVTTSAIENWYSLSPIQSPELIEFQASFHFGDP